MSKHYDPVMCMMVEDTVKTKDASRGHEIVLKTQNYLSSIGKNNSVGKYDRVVRGVKSLLEQGFLEGPELDRAIKQEADRLLKKYNLDEAPTIDKAVRNCDYTVEEVESKGPYMLSKSGSGRWAVMKNGVVLKYGNESDMRKLYKTVLRNNGYANDSKTYSKDANTIDKAIKNCDAMSDLKNSIPVGNAYVKQEHYDFVVYNSKGQKVGSYATPDEAEKAAMKVK